MWKPVTCFQLTVKSDTLHCPGYKRNIKNIYCVNLLYAKFKGTFHDYGQKERKKTRLCFNYY